jgi:nicotinamidase-related amidase
MPTRSRFPQARTAVLLIDVLNPFDFPGGEAFARRARRTASAIARLADRARRGHIPVVYVNDNLGRWRSDMASLLSFCSHPHRPGATIVQALRPHDEDHLVLKSTLSGFFQTPLETMLRSGGVRTLVLPDSSRITTCCSPRPMPTCGISSWSWQQTVSALNRVTHTARRSS